ncbi:MAG: hypothetical protein K9M54_07705 [Kiritimatiellales bacterium]|nr:hypothetical protein [Kiritimatiellales bacterium]MCF7863382.1 hypothetical protein [Kiritimatiellales bacterium]
MKRHLQWFAAFLLVLLSGKVFALDTVALLDDPAMVALLAKKCIRAETCGVLPVRFEAVADLLRQPDLIWMIQDEYGRSVSKGGKNEFPIIGTGNGAYHYINEKNQRTDIKELYRRQTSDSTVDLVYHASGKRYFGKYEVLIHVRAIDAGTAGTLYLAAIHAYPHNPPLRFFARKFGSTERYFQRKTAMIARISTRICEGMCGHAYPTYTERRIESFAGFL